MREPLVTARPLRGPPLEEGDCSSLTGNISSWSATRTKTAETQSRELLTVSWPPALHDVGGTEQRRYALDSDQRRSHPRQRHDELRPRPAHGPRRDTDHERHEVRRIQDNIITGNRSWKPCRQGASCRNRCGWAPLSVTK